MSFCVALSCRVLCAMLLALAALCVAAPPAAAVDATWNLNGTGAYPNAANWTPATVPDGTATFGVSNQNGVLLGLNTNIGGWTFNAGASNYTFTNEGTLNFNGAGIVINGGSASITNDFNIINFQNTSTAGSASITNNSGNINFQNTSTAGSATITNTGQIIFFNTSTAGNATITNNFNLNFLDTSTAGSATIINNSLIQFVNTSTAGSANITNTLNGLIDFQGSNTAGSANIANNGRISFDNTSTAGSAAITNNLGGSIKFQNTSTAGSAIITNSGTLSFVNTSTAGSASITNNGTLNFLNFSTAGSAAITNNAGGVVDFSGSTGPANDNRLAAGSIAGAGTYILGANELTVGSNNLSTEASGVISGNLGSLVKVGTGTLTLSGADTYTGGTTISAGTLALSGVGSIASSSGVLLAAGAFFDISGLTAGGTTIQSLAGTGGTVTLGPKTLTLANASGTFGGAITGNGGLTLTAGTETLIGANTYTGGTTINGGILNVGSAGALGTTGTISFTGGTLQYSAANTTDYSSRFSNAANQAYHIDTNGQTVTVQTALTSLGGTFTKDGMGTLSFSGANTYSGATTINAGTLMGAATNTFSAASATTINTGGTLDLGFLGQTINTVLLSGGTLANGSLSGAVSSSGGTVSNIGGTATLTTNSGTTTVNGTNTYTGATTVNGGTLALSAGASIASSSLVTVGTGGATATFDISGTSSGASIKGLTGASDGAVTLGNQTLTSTAGSSVNIFFGAINGNGGLTVTGGVQNLGGATTYGGVTTINSGAVLGIEGTGTIASSSKVVDNGDFDMSVASAPGTSIKSLAGTDVNALVFLGSQTLTLTAANDTFAGAVNNGGGLTLTSGTETLTGTSGYTGATTINGGTLVINGSIATSSQTTVNSAATLTGVGAVGATIVASNGTLAPGNGTPGSSMTVSSLSLASGAFYIVQINPTTSSFAHVTGTATLGGATVETSFASGSYVAKQYTILTAGAVNGVSGTFNPTVVNTSLPSGFHSTLSYDANDAYLNLALNFVPPGGGLNANQQTVANAIVGFFNSNGSIPLVFGGLTAAGITQISGETATGTQQTTFDAMTQFMGVMTDPFIGGRGDGITAGSSATPFAEEIDAANAYAAKDPSRSQSERDAYAAIYRKAPTMVAPFIPSWSVWSAGYGGSQTTNGNTVIGSNATTSRLGAVAVGADYRLSPYTIAGFALAGGGTNFSVNGFGTGHSDLFQAGAFVRHTVGPAYFTAALAYGWQDITTDRIVTIAGIDHLRAEFNANAFSGRAESGYRFVSSWMGGIGITPYAAAQFTTFDLPAYAEQTLTGASTFALNYAAKDVTDTRSELGIRSDKSFALQDGILTLRGRFAWAHDFNPDRSIAATFQALPGASFVVNGAAQASDSALTTASIERKWMNGWSAAATFEGEFSEVTRSYAGKGVVRYSW